MKRMLSPNCVLVLSSTKRVMSPLSSTAPMKNIEFYSDGAAGNIWCPNKVNKTLKTALGLVVIFFARHEGALGNWPPGAMSERIVGLLRSESAGIAA
jgi:hypothetical protein